MSHWKKLSGFSLLVVLLLLGAACDRDRSVKFAAILPLSGPFEAYGNAIKKGVEIAFEQVEASGKLAHPIELIIVDSESNPAQAAAHLRDLYADGVLAAIGGVTSAEALAMVQVANQEDRILLSPSASSPELTGASRYFFRVFPSDFVEGTRMGVFAAETLRLKTAVILATETPYGRGIQSVFEGEFQRNGGEIVEVLEYPEHTTDFSGLVGRVVTLEPDAVYFAAYWDDIVALMREIRQAGYEGSFLTTSAFATPRAVAAAGEYAEGVYFTQTVLDVTSEAEPVRSFVRIYRQKHGNDPDLYAAHGYDAMLVLVEALQEGGTTPTTFWRGMRSVQGFAGVTGPVQFDERGDVQKFPRVYTIRDGMPVNYEEYAQRLREAFRERLRELEDEQRALRAVSPP
jgi:branched-chain amino acid transport system substrate-binding protein